MLFFVGQGLQATPQKFIVVIDAGHGGKDPGAQGFITNEKTINLGVALKLGALIEQNHSDVEVVYTRETDIFIDLDERANIANRNKADLFISIHTNSLKKGSSVKGAEIYTLGLARSDENLKVAIRENSAILLEDNYLQKYEGFDPTSSESYIIFEFMQNKHMEQSICFASEIQKRFVKLKRVNRGVRQAGFLVLRKTGMPSVLIELGYISNKEEERFMKSAEGQEKLAKAISNAFTKYKSEYDRKQGALAKETHAVSDRKPAADQHGKKKIAEPVAVEKKISPPPSEDQIIYKVQIFISDKKLAPGSPFFKGYKSVDFYEEKGIYKYTYGATTDFNEIRKLRRQVAKDFKGAFIVAFEKGKKVNY